MYILILQWNIRLIESDICVCVNHWEKNPLYLNKQEWCANYWEKKGAPRNKLVIGVPTYGRGFTLDNPDQNGLYAPAGRPSQPGDFTREAGFLAYYEVNSASHYYHILTAIIATNLLKLSDVTVITVIPFCFARYALRSSRTVGCEFGTQSTRYHTPTLMTSGSVMKTSTASRGR